MTEGELRYCYTCKKALPHREEQFIFEACVLCSECVPKLTPAERAVGKREEVNHPLHYGGDTVYETINVIEAWGLGFNLGNAVKYISRADKRPEVSLTDLRKAVWYLQREIWVRESLKTRMEREVCPDASH